MKESKWDTPQERFLRTEGRNEKIEGNIITQLYIFMSSVLIGSLVSKIVPDLMLAYSKC